MDQPSSDIPVVRPVEGSPRRYPPPPPPPPREGGGFWRALLALALVGSLALNFFLCAGGTLLTGLFSKPESLGSNLSETLVAGSPSASDKVAVIRVEGGIMEGMLNFAHQQIAEAARDKAVKAVVVRIVSPGGTITASDDLYHKLVDLRDGKTHRIEGSTSRPRPLVASMGAMAASGGYYIAMPAVDSANPDAPKIFAERSTITGSIGVYASLPNVSDLANRHGVKMEMIKAGDIKGSGSLFHNLSPQERQPWQDMVNHAYRQFLSVVETGRPKLKGQLEKELFPAKAIPIYDDKGNVVQNDDKEPKTASYTRKRADGGIFTADEAKEYGLVDAIGDLDDAIAEVAKQANLTKYRAIQYERPLSLISAITGNAKAPDWSKLANSLSPAIWVILPEAHLGLAADALSPR